jgi:phosphohistidine phosphatase SixA
MAAAPELELWIVRHGETEANRAGIVQGQSESPLSPLGAAQARRAAAALAGRRWWRVVSSDLGRTRQTAELLLDPGGAVAGAGRLTDAAPYHFLDISGCMLAPWQPAAPMSRITMECSVGVDA